MKLMLGSLVFLVLAAVIAADCPAAKGFEGKPTEAFIACNATFCKDAGDVLLVPVGDVNDDGFEDLVCHKGSGLIHVALNTKQGGFSSDGNPAEGIENGWCKGPKQVVFVGDFDGDNRADLLCHSYQTGSKDVRLRNESGNSYSNPTVEEATLVGWCILANAELHVADFDGDGKADLLCHHNGTGAKWLAKSKLPQNGFVQTQYAPIGWCFHATSKLYVADTNGDASSDILCHDDQGTTWIIKSIECSDQTAACSTQFDTSDAHTIKGHGICPGNTLGHMPRYHLIDFNGDGEADHYCHKTTPEQDNCVLTGSLAGSGANEDCAWQSGANYCNNEGDLLIFGHFFGTRRDDILCVRGNTYHLLRNHGL
ncbi:uncharacterized protein LOC135500422 [Lineus longissimus]|uniref:uncharacterized protein LOC135500422 n=1 Tax=Lineus longissimus TaxID=88925 RepID=UPI00315DE90C